MFEEAWKEGGVPAAQWQVAGPELERIKRGEWEKVPPFDVLRTPFGTAVKYCHSKPTVLDIGAASGYYREVLQQAGFDFDYTGMDYSEAFKAFAKSKYPDIQYVVGDATEVPFTDDRFDIVLHGACIMHVAEWKKAVKEAYRVAKKFVIWHRTPILWKEPTKTFTKMAYHVQCEETHFNFEDFNAEIEKAGGQIVSMFPIFETEYPDRTKQYGHYIFLTVKDPHE